MNDFVVSVPRGLVSFQLCLIMKRKRDSDHRNEPKSCLVKVFTGGMGSVQSAQFFIALDEVVGRYYHQDDALIIVVERIGTEEVRKKGWNVQQFISWLVSGDVYFILSHPGQGISVTLGWDLGSLGDDLVAGLRGHLGFPAGDSLRCPVFTQDKYNYLDACRTICLPSLRIARTQDGYLNADIRAQVIR